MPYEPIEIKELLVQGECGQRKQAIVVMEYLQQIIKDSGEPDADRIDKVMTLIEALAKNASENHQDDDKKPGQITRTITDEFSFYPKNRPFSIEEYKTIINRAAVIADKLPPDIHLVLATFPVLWLDGGIHNCGLYINSPLKEGDRATLYHFSKQNPFYGDIQYRKDDELIYPLTSDVLCDKQSLPNVLFSDTRLNTNDINQYESALKLSTSDGRTFITSIGICRDHTFGLEREQVHHLIDQLQANHQAVPLHCSHVITSDSVEEYAMETISTISHADSSIGVRHFPYPAREGYETQNLSSDFSGALSAESYPPKHIGTLHSDLLQHVIANEVGFDSIFNEQDKDGNTLLHRVFQEVDFDTELMNKRLYSMILHGGDPTLVNRAGFSVIHLAKQADKQAFSGAFSPVFNAIHCALAWRGHLENQNAINPHDKRTHLTRELQYTPHDLDKIRALIMSGANPYKKDGLSQNAMDIIDSWGDEREHYKRYLRSFFKETQYGHYTSVLTKREDVCDRFTPPKLTPDEVNVAYLIYDDLRQSLAKNDESGFIAILSQHTPREVELADTLGNSYSALHRALERSTLYKNPVDSKDTPPSAVAASNPVRQNPPSKYTKPTFTWKHSEAPYQWDDDDHEGNTTLGMSLNT